MLQLPAELWSIIFDLVLDFYPSLDSSPIPFPGDIWTKHAGFTPYSPLRRDLQTRNKVANTLLLVCKAWKEIAQRRVFECALINSFQSWTFLEETLQKLPESSRPLPERINIDISYESKWPVLDPADLPRLTRPFRTICQNLQLLTFHSRIECGQIAPIMHAIFQEVSKSLRVFDWISCQHHEDPV
jgi:hypothetical protein